MLCLRLFIAVKRHHDHSNSYKHLIWADLQFRGFVHMVMAEPRQTWCWRRSREFYIWTQRQQEETMSH